MKSFVQRRWSAILSVAIIAAWAAGDALESKWLILAPLAAYWTIFMAACYAHRSKSTSKLAQCARWFGWYDVKRRARRIIDHSSPLIQFPLIVWLDLGSAEKTYVERGNDAFADASSEHARLAGEDMMRLATFMVRQKARLSSHEHDTDGKGGVPTSAERIGQDGGEARPV